MSQNLKKESITNRNLNEILKELNDSKKVTRPSEISMAMEKANEDLKAFNFKEQTLQIGDLFPNATLLDHKGIEISFTTALDNKPAIISFYRGTWCPYCNLELAYYSELLGKKENKGVRMFAISPEKPDITMEKTDAKSLNLTICSDIDNKLAKKLNLVFGLPEKIQAIYKKFGIDVDGSQGNTNRELPIPATFIIDKEGRVTYINLDEDYTVRAEANEVVGEYKKIM